MNAKIYSRVHISKGDIKVLEVTPSRITGRLDFETTDDTLLDLLRRSKAAAEEQLFLEVDRIDQQIANFQLIIKISDGREEMVRRLFLGDDCVLTVEKWPSETGTP